MKRIATFRDPRYNSYVPSAGYAADIIHAGPHKVDFGTPALASATAILSAQSIAVAGSTTTLLLNTIVEPFGRNLTVIASGAATSNVTISGWDYLGQPMTESFTLNGAASVIGVKAFKVVGTVTFGATGATTINVGTGARFGLPYRMSNAITEVVDGASAAAGTFSAGSLTDPQIATTADPRGLYTPTTTPNNIKQLGAVFIPNDLINANGNGGLYGIRHFSS